MSIVWKTTVIILCLTVFLDGFLLYQSKERIANLEVQVSTYTSTNDELAKLVSAYKATLKDTLQLAGEIQTEHRTTSLQLEYLQKKEHDRIFSK